MFNTQAGRNKMCAALLATALVFFAACQPPKPSDFCPAAAINDNIPAPKLDSIKVNGQLENVDSLHLRSTKEELSLFFEPSAGWDTLVVLIDLPGLPPCGRVFEQTNVQFTFIPGGKYVLEYWSLHKGQASKHGFLRFTVEEALVEQTWFYPALVAYILLLLGALAYFWMLYNLRQKLKIQQIRSSLAADLHDEVSSDLSSAIFSIAALRRNLCDDPEQSSAILQDISKTLSSTQRNLLDTVWAIRPDKDTIAELLQRMEQFAKKIFASGTPVLHFKRKIPEKLQIRLSMEQRHHIFKIYKEALHNVSKHAQAQTVNITLGTKDGGFLLEIIDDGVGFDPALNYDGNGVSNYWKRAEEACLDFELKSSPGEGCCLQLVAFQL